MASKDQIIQEIAAHFQKCGGSYKEWYCGVASDAQKRLFNDHNVDRNGWWIYRDCENSDEARAVEEYFLKLGMKGGPGGGDWTTKAVYAYKITNSTRE